MAFDEYTPSYMIQSEMEENKRMREKTRQI